MILDSSIRLEAVLSGAKTTNDMQTHVDYTTWTTQGVETKPLPSRGATNGVTDVTLLDKTTTQGEVRDIKFASLYNKDTVSSTVTVKTDDGTNEREIVRVTLATLETLIYEKGGGWYVIAANGAIKNGAGVSGPTSSTDNALARWDGTTGTVIQSSSGATLADDGTLSNTLQPAFLVTNSGTLTDVTGDNTSYTIVFGTEIFDQNADFASNTFTAPVTGRYQLSLAILIAGLTASHTILSCLLNTSNRSYIFAYGNAAAMRDTTDNLHGFSGSILADMDAGDTATVALRVNGGTKVVDVDTVHFSGVLSC